jgi:hypothetical protein
MYLIQERSGNSQRDPSKHKRARTSTNEHERRPNKQVAGTRINKHTNGRMNERDRARPKARAGTDNGGSTIGHDSSGVGSSSGNGSSGVGSSSGNGSSGSCSNSSSRGAAAAETTAAGTAAAGTA